MRHIWKVILIGSIFLNLLVGWGVFHYVRYGGSPAGELKRMLTGTGHQAPAAIPFSEENAQLRKLLDRGHTDSTRVVFIGSSITSRWHLERHFPEVSVINRGLEGQLAPGMLFRFRRDVIALEPRATVIELSSGNFRPGMRMSVLKDAVMAMADLAVFHDIRPIVTTVVPGWRPEVKGADFSVPDSLGRFNEWVRQFSEERELPLIDLNRAIADEAGFLSKEYSTDSVHPNERGYQALAEAARRVLYEAVGIS